MPLINLDDTLAETLELAKATLTAHDNGVGVGKTARKLAAALLAIDSAILDGASVPSRYSLSGVY